MKRKLLPLALSLALLAGCAPAPGPSPSPTAEATPSPTPTPAAAVDFHAFLDEVNETRRAVIEDGEPLDISAWTPDFTDQNHTFTDEEIGDAGRLVGPPFPAAFSQVYGMSEADAAEVTRRRAEIDAWQQQIQEEARARAQAELAAREAELAEIMRICSDIIPVIGGNA